MTPEDDLDAPIWGAEDIGRAAHVVDEKGNVKLGKTFYLLSSGLLPGKKIGKQWTSTKRQIYRRVNAAFDRS
jgi:hypothetical protein